MSVCQYRQPLGYLCKQNSTVCLLATAVDKYGKRAVTKAFFPISEKQTTRKNSYFPTVYNIGDRTWEAKIISPQIWNYG